MASDKEQPSGASPKKGGKVKLGLMLLAACVAMPFTLPSIVLILAGLVPMYIAYATDSDPEKSGAASVGAMNFAGIVPFLIDLWTKGQTLDNALRMLMDTHTWVVILGAAAVGQLIVYAVPPAIAAMSSTTAEARVKALKKNLELLKESWGPEVASGKSGEKEP